MHLILLKLDLLDRLPVECPEGHRVSVKVQVELLIVRSDFIEQLILFLLQVDDLFVFDLQLDLSLAL